MMPIYLSLNYPSLNYPFPHYPSLKVSDTFCRSCQDNFLNWGILSGIDCVDICTNGECYFNQKDGFKFLQNVKLEPTHINFIKKSKSILFSQELDKIKTHNHNKGSSRWKLREDFYVGFTWTKIGEYKQDKILGVTVPATNNIILLVTKNYTSAQNIKNNIITINEYYLNAIDYSLVIHKLTNCSIGNKICFLEINKNTRLFSNGFYIELSNFTTGLVEYEITFKHPFNYSSRNNRLLWHSYDRLLVFSDSCQKIIDVTSNTNKKTSKKHKTGRIEFFGMLKNRLFHTEDSNKMEYYYQSDNVHINSEIGQTRLLNKSLYVVDDRISLWDLEAGKKLKYFRVPPLLFDILKQVNNFDISDPVNERTITSQKLATLHCGKPELKITPTLPTTRWFFLQHTNSQEIDYNVIFLEIKALPKSIKIFSPELKRSQKEPYQMIYLYKLTKKHTENLSKVDLLSYDILEVSKVIGIIPPNNECFLFFDKDNKCYYYVDQYGQSLSCKFNENLQIVEKGSGATCNLWGNLTGTFIENKLNNPSAKSVNRINRINFNVQKVTYSPTIYQCVLAKTRVIPETARLWGQIQKVISDNYLENITCCVCFDIKNEYVIFDRFASFELTTETETSNKFAYQEDRSRLSFDQDGQRHSNGLTALCNHSVCKKCYPGVLELFSFSSNLGSGVGNNTRDVQNNINEAGQPNISQQDLGLSSNQDKFRCFICASISNITDHVHLVRIKGEKAYVQKCTQVREISEGQNYQTKLLLHVARNDIIEESAVTVSFARSLKVISYLIVILGLITALFVIMFKVKI